MPTRILQRKAWPADYRLFVLPRGNKQSSDWIELTRRLSQLLAWIVCGRHRALSVHQLPPGNVVKRHWRGLGSGLHTLPTEHVFDFVRGDQQLDVHPMRAGLLHLDGRIGVAVSMHRTSLPFRSGTRSIDGRLPGLCSWLVCIRFYVRGLPDRVVLNCAKVHKLLDM